MVTIIVNTIKQIIHTYPIIIVYLQKSLLESLLPVDAFTQILAFRAKPFKRRRFLKISLYLFICKNSTANYSSTFFSLFSLPKVSSSQVPAILAKWVFRKRFLKMFIYSYVKIQIPLPLWPHPTPGDHDLNTLESTLST